MTERGFILERLNQLATEEKYITALIYLCDEHLTANAETIKSRNVKELLNLNELLFLFGLWVKHKNGISKSEIPLHDLTRIIPQLMNEIHETFLEHFPKIDSDTYYEDFRSSPEGIKETIFYAGTGAYDYQFLNFIQNKYAEDINWLKLNKDFDLNEVKNLFIYIKSSINHKLNRRENKMDFISTYSFSFNNYVFKKNPGFLKILDAFSINDEDVLNQEFNELGDLNYFGFKPVIKTDSAYLIPLPYFLAEAFYDSPFFWMLEDKTYKPRALKNRGDSAEKIVRKIFEQTIPSDLVHSELEVSKLKSETTTDIDVCLLKGSKMLIFQIKSKRLTQLAKTGNLIQFYRDFKLAVMDAHVQALKPYDLILNTDCKLIQKETREVVDCTSVDEIYSACIVFDSYPSITSHTRLFFDKGDITPITMSIFDLEIIMEYLTTFEQLFDYMKKRTLLSKKFIADKELDFLHHYIKNDLVDNPEADLMVLSQKHAQLFDHEYYLPLRERYEIFYPIFLRGIERNDQCYCGSGKKFKKCCVNFPSMTFKS